MKREINPADMNKATKKITLQKYEADISLDEHYIERELRLMRETRDLISLNHHI